MLLAWVLLGCEGVGLEPSAGDSGVDEAGAVRIDRVEPAFGPVGGGNAVTITGAGFEGSVAVAFGNAEVSATRVGADAVVVTAPYAGAPMTVDLTVRSDLGEATLADAYTFGEASDTADTGSGDTADTGWGDTGAGGGTSGVLEFSFLVYGCPECFGLTQQAFVAASAAFHAPVRASWVDWLPAIGSCTSSFDVRPPADSFLDAGDWLYLSAGSTSIGLRGTIAADGTRYAASGVSTGDFVRSAAFDLRALGGGDLPAFDAVDAVRTPQGFDDIQPVALLNDASAAFEAVLPRSGATFSWAPSGGDGSFVVLMQVYSADGSRDLGAVLCRGADNGRLTVPGSYLSGFPRNALVAVTLQRYQIGNFPTPGGTAESVATIGAVGTGVLQ